MADEHEAASPQDQPEQSQDQPTALDRAIDEQARHFMTEVAPRMRHAYLAQLVAQGYVHLHEMEMGPFMVQVGAPGPVCEAQARVLAEQIGLLNDAMSEEMREEMLALMATKLAQAKVRLADNPAVFN